MAKTQKDQIWVLEAEADGENVAQGLERKVLAYGAEMMCVQNSFVKGGVGGLHSHPHTQIAYIAAGVFEFTIDGETKTVRRGDSMFIQGGVPHGCACLEKGVVLDLFTPMREDFV